MKVEVADLGFPFLIMDRVNQCTVLCTLLCEAGQVL